MVVSDEQLTRLFEEIAALRKQVDRIELIVDDILHSLPDPDDGLELRPEVEGKLKRSLQRPASEFLSLEEAFRRAKEGKPQNAARD